MSRPCKEIYIPEGFKHTWKKFMELCDREGSSGSKKIREFVRDYVRRHEPGNPQLPIFAFFEKREATTMTRLCEQCNRPAEYIVFLWPDEKNCQEHYLCDVHSKAALRGSWMRTGRRKL